MGGRKVSPKSGLAGVRRCQPLPPGGSKLHGRICSGWPFFHDPSPKNKRLGLGPAEGEGMVDAAARVAQDHVQPQGRAANSTGYVDGDVDRSICPGWCELTLGVRTDPDLLVLEGHWRVWCPSLLWSHLLRPLIPQCLGQGCGPREHPPSLTSAWPPLGMGHWAAGLEAEVLRGTCGKSRACRQRRPTRSPGPEGRNVWTNNQMRERTRHAS